jgi:hypothetical protein
MVTYTKNNKKNQQIVIFYTVYTIKNMIRLTDVVK